MKIENTKALEMIDNANALSEQFEMFNRLCRTYVEALTLDDFILVCVYDVNDEDANSASAIDSKKNVLREAYKCSNEEEYKSIMHNIMSDMLKHFDFNA